METKGDTTVKTKKARFVLRLAVIALAVYAVINILKLQIEIGRAQEDIAALEQEINRQQAENALLEEKIQSGMDEDAIKDAARSELGMVEPGEEVFVDVSD